MPADTDRRRVIEELVALMQGSLKGYGRFSVADGLSAALSFANRFAIVAIDLSAPADRETNRRHIIHALHAMAANIERPHGDDVIH